jgi:hypothetical protein
MKILLDIKDSQTAFALEVLKSLSFVKNAKPLSKDSLNLLSDLQDSIADVKLHQKGKLELKTAQELINEL